MIGVDTLDVLRVSPKHAEVSRGVLERAGLGERVTVLPGPGMEVLPTIEREGPFDAVFVDANKEDYPRYVEWATRNLRPGGKTTSLTRNGPAATDACRVVPSETATALTDS